MQTHSSYGSRLFFLRWKFAGEAFYNASTDLSYIMLWHDDEAKDRGDRPFWSHTQRGYLGHGDAGRMARAWLRQHGLIGDDNADWNQRDTWYLQHTLPQITL